MITARLLRNTTESWDRDCKNMFESQRKYNEEALAWSKARLEKWASELESNEQKHQI